ncbi:MAG: LysE family translocator [Cyclobacteriaceae bacterium]
MTPEPFFTFVLFVTALYGTPGPATLSIAASGAAFGFRRTITYVLGGLMGLVIIFIMVAFGLMVLFTEYPTVHLVFKWVSLFYIFYLAYKIATATTIKSDGPEQLGFLRGIPLALLNPKAYFAIIATVSQFVKQGDGYHESFILVVVWAISLTLVFDLAWAYTGSMIGSRLGSRGLSAKVNVLFAILLIASVVITMFMN